MKIIKLLMFFSSFYLFSAEQSCNSYKEQRIAETNKRIAEIEHLKNRLTSDPQYKLHLNEELKKSGMIPQSETVMETAKRTYNNAVKTINKLNEKKRLLEMNIQVHKCEEDEIENLLSKLSF